MTWKYTWKKDTGFYKKTLVELLHQWCPTETAEGLKW